MIVHKAGVGPVLFHCKTKAAAVMYFNGRRFIAADDSGINGISVLNNIGTGFPDILHALDI